MDKHVDSIHMSKPRDVNFICGICGHEFSKEENYNLHVETHDGQPQTPPQVVPRDEVAEVILVESPDNQIVTLDEAPEVRQEEADIQGSSGDKEKCNKCDKIIRTKIAQERHRELYCEKCEKCLSERVNFNLHMDLLHKENEQYTCERCEKEVTSLMELQNHLCEPTPEFECIECANIFNSCLELEWHMETIHEKELNLHNCKDCDFIAQNQEDLKAHKTIHHEAIQFPMIDRKVV